MPKKYPTINSPLTTRTTLTAGGTAGLSNSDKNLLSRMFPNSPIYSFNEDDYRTLAKSYLQPDLQEDTTSYPHFTSPVDMNYGQSPDVASITSIGSAPIDSPYYPNLIVNPDPAGLEEGTPTGSPISPNDNFGSGNTVDNVTPKKTASIISQANIETSGPIAPLGQSGANLPGSGGTVTTHDVNPGADSDGI